MNKKHISIKKSDSLLDIIDKIEREHGNEIYLEPEDSSELSNYLNLKLILFRFAEKRFFIVTNETAIKKLGEPLGIRFFQRNDNIEFEQEYAKKHILQHNFTFLEYFLYEIRKFLSKLTFVSRKKITVYKNKKKIKDSNVFLLVSGLIISLSLLIFIFYFAVSKTYVYITPELSVKTVSRNIVFAEKEAGVLDSKNIVNVKPVSLTTDFDYTFNVTTIDQMSAKNAYGTVEIYNELRQEQVFRPNTRFSTDDGLIYKTNDWIKLPPATTESGTTVLGKTTVTLTADLYDTKGDIIGVRGNIWEGTVLTIPWLKFNRDKIYGKTTSPFIGGLDPKIHVLTDVELKKFKDIITEKLKSKALDELKAQIQKTNTDNAENYDILPINDNLVYTPGDINMGSGTKIGDKRDEVTLHGTMKISTYTFDRNATLFYLRTILNESLLFGTEKLIGTNDNSLRISNVINRLTTPSFSMKATSELDSTISYNFEDAGNNLTKKLKNLILGSTPKDATSILLNDNNIASVKISFSPFWLTRVSSNPDNIEFIIEKK